MSGEKVIVRTCGDIPQVCRLVKAGPGVVFVTNDEQFGLLASGNEHILMVGIPEEDVYSYDPKAEKQMHQMIDSKGFAWDKLHRWEGPQQG